MFGDVALSEVALDDVVFEAVALGAVIFEAVALGGATSGNVALPADVEFPATKITKALFTVSGDVSLMQTFISLNKRLKI